jgi:hypothetical protein
MSAEPQARADDSGWHQAQDRGRANDTIKWQQAQDRGRANDTLKTSIRYNQLIIMIQWIIIN